MNKSFYAEAEVAAPKVKWDDLEDLTEGFTEVTYFLSGGEKWEATGSEVVEDGWFFIIRLVSDSEAVTFTLAAKLTDYEEDFVLRSTN